MIPWAVRPSSAFEAAPVRLPGSLSMAEDGELESQRLPAPIRFPDGASQPGRFILHGGRRTIRKPQFPAHPLATEPGTPVRFTFPGAAGGDKRTARYAQTGSAVISPPHCVPHPGFEPGTSSF